MSKPGRNAVEGVVFLRCSFECRIVCTEGESIEGDKKFN